jgi:hypothetical protein
MSSRALGPLLMGEAVAEGCALTICIKVPTSEAVSATMRLRKVGDAAVATDSELASFEGRSCSTVGFCPD